VVEAVRLTMLLNRVDWRKEAWVEGVVIVDRGMQDRRGCIARMILLGGIFVRVNIDLSETSNDRVRLLN
jgi:hypothetical protein